MVRDRRRAAGLSQAELAARAEVSMRWLAGLEPGKPGAEIGLVLRTFAALGIELTAADIPSPRPCRVDFDPLFSRFYGPPRCAQHSVSRPRRPWHYAPVLRP